MGEGSDSRPSIMALEQKRHNPLSRHTFWTDELESKTSPLCEVMISSGCLSSGAQYVQHSHRWINGTISNDGWSIELEECIGHANTPKVHPAGCFTMR